ncbi:2-dehydro-3-deoxygalactonokinase [Vallitalea longa]|uniref:2-dehydro-3-deoxygalactonokinase n=1 Tax=Vallitalea longa TaxID=2936439 RepID=A0A9W6DFP6_9FIRM|nr:2-dehydro-3-deoxygalactonokinase [Vallitalea longa]GKX29687.1 2-dehydro-3-deoxygalactonokinase [Vallitalea longa]
MSYITIDTGTTNTRIRYISDDEILGESKIDTGVRDTAITGNKEKLKKSIKSGIHDCMKNTHINVEDVDKIIAFGMITSNLGLLEIPHLESPVGVDDLRKHVEKKIFTDIIDKPIYFIPGVKNKSGDEIYEVDMMRGEETETVRAMSYGESEFIYVSPGSHTKFVFVEDNKIIKCSTTLSGEMMKAISQHTVLADSLPHDLIEHIDRKYICKGIEAASEYGFSRTCFMVRILDVLSDTTDNERANFIAGAIGYMDIQSIKHEMEWGKIQFIIGGNKILQELYKNVLEITGYDKNKIVVLSKEEVDVGSSLAAIKIVE